MRILFMGTPEFAVPSLKALLEAGHDVCGVFTQPDRPKNRGMKLIPSPVKEFALANKIPVFQPESLKQGDAFADISKLNPELIVVAAYGRILPRDILDFPPCGCINVHSSLLPKYRGAAPIHWAVINGDGATGVTIMHMAQELDAGDIIDQVSTPIDPEESVEAVHDRLACLGGGLLVKVLSDLKAGTAKRTPQEHEKASYAPMLTRALSPIDWNKPAIAIHNQIRGLTPWPATVTDNLSAQPVKVYQSKLTGEGTRKAPGAVVAAGKEGIDVACGDGSVLRLTQVQIQGSRRMSAADYVRGHPIEVS